MLLRVLFPGVHFPSLFLTCPCGPLKQDLECGFTSLNHVIIFCSLCAQLSQLLVGCRKREDEESSKSNLRHAHLGPSAEARMMSLVCIMPHRICEFCRSFSISWGCDPAYFDFSHFCDVSVMLSSAGKNACVPCLFDKESSIQTPGSNTFLLPEYIGREPFPS